MLEHLFRHRVLQMLLRKVHPQNLWVTSGSGRSPSV
jgi:hypothetical protein